MRTIYGLRSKTDGVVRYVGQTGQELRQRLRAHINSAKLRRQALHHWILGEKDNNSLEIFVIAVVQQDLADAKERELIQQYRVDGLLLNFRDGCHGNRDKALIYPISVVSDDNGSFLIACPTLPEVTTFSTSAAQIIRRANDAIEEAIWARAR